MNGSITRENLYFVGYMVYHVSKGKNKRIMLDLSATTMEEAEELMQFCKKNSPKTTFELAKIYDDRPYDVNSDNSNVKEFLELSDGKFVRIQ